MEALKNVSKKVAEKLDDWRSRVANKVVLWLLMRWS